MNLSAWFFQNKKNRKVDDIDNLWELFEAAIIFADNSNKYNEERFINGFDKVLKQKQIEWNITMGLFWIRPYTFLNFDSRDRGFLMKEGNPYKVQVSNYSDLKFPSKGRAYIKIIEYLQSEFQKTDSPH